MKEEKYRLLTDQIHSLIDGETDSVAVMATVCAAIHETMGFFWTGFYRVVGDELVLGPFQACRMHAYCIRERGMRLSVEAEEYYCSP